MNIGEAVAIFKNINLSERTAEEKKSAIRTVLGMDTHNGITKQEFINALDWMLNYSIENKMSGDLISRSALLKEMEDYCGEQRYLIPDNVWDMVKNMPVAYDVDGMAGKLEMKSEQYKNPVSSDSGFRRFCEGISAGYRYAAVIVKAGGVDE